MDLTPLYDFSVLNGVGFAKCRLCGGTHIIGRIPDAEESLEIIGQEKFTVDFELDVTEIAACVVAHEDKMRKIMEKHCVG